MEPADIDLPRRETGPIADILEEASRLSAPGILALGRAYPTDPIDRTERTRLLDVAGGRDGRLDELRRLKAASAQAVQKAAADRRAEVPLARLGALIEAELAVQDMVLAVFLRDRLGDEQVERLSHPWANAR